jgi:hypothetical protein
VGLSYVSVKIYYFFHMIKANTICVWGIGLRLAPVPFISPSNSCWDKYFPYGGNRLYSYNNKKPPLLLKLDCITDEGRTEGKQREFLCPFSLRVHPNFFRIMVHHCCCVQARFLDKETKIFSPCYGLFSAI